MAGGKSSPACTDARRDGALCLPYLGIALVTELFDLPGGDVSVLVTLAALVEGQASADSALPGSWGT